MSRLLLDAGAFVAFERGNVNVRARLSAARRLGLELATTAPVVAQVWRDGRRQALIARLLAATRIDAPEETAARMAEGYHQMLLDMAKSSIQTNNAAAALELLKKMGGHRR